MISTQIKAIALLVIFLPIQFNCSQNDKVLSPNRNGPSFASNKKIDKADQVQEYIEPNQPLGKPDIEVFLYDNRAEIRKIDQPSNTNQSSLNNQIYIVPASSIALDSALSEMEYEIDGENWYIFGLPKIENNQDEQLNLSGKFSISKSAQNIFAILKKNTTDLRSSFSRLQSKPTPSTQKNSWKTAGNFQINGVYVPKTIAGEETIELFDSFKIGKNPTPIDLAKVSMKRRHSFGGDTDQVEQLNRSLSRSAKIFDMSQSLFVETNKKLENVARNKSDIDLGTFSTNKQLDEFMQKTYANDLHIFDEYSLAIESSKPFQWKRNELLDQLSNKLKSDYPLLNTKSGFAEVRSAYTSGIKNGKQGDELEKHVTDAFLLNRFPNQSIIGNDAIRGVKNQLDIFFEKNRDQMNEVSKIENYLDNHVNKLEERISHYINDQGSFSDAEIAVFTKKYSEGDQTVFSKFMEAQGKRGREVMDPYFDQLDKIKE